MLFVGIILEQRVSGQGFACWEAVQFPGVVSRFLWGCLTRKLRSLGSQR